MEPAEELDKEVWRAMFLKKQIDKNGQEELIPCNAKGEELAGVTAKRLARLRVWAQIVGRLARAERLGREARLSKEERQRRAAEEAEAFRQRAAATLSALKEQ